MPRTCPSTGKVCIERVCNEGAFPCDPDYARSLLGAFPAPKPSPAIEETEDGIVLAVEVEAPPSFKIED
jgi:hypothetical protein